MAEAGRAPEAPGRPMPLTHSLAAPFTGLPHSLPHSGPPPHSRVLDAAAARLALRGCAQRGPQPHEPGVPAGQELELHGR